MKSSANSSPTGFIFAAAVLGALFSPAALATPTVAQAQLSYAEVDDQAPSQGDLAVVTYRLHGPSGRALPKFTKTWAYDSGCWNLCTLEGYVVQCRDYGGLAVIESHADTVVIRHYDDAPCVDCYASYTQGPSSQQVRYHKAPVAFNASDGRWYVAEKWAVSNETEVAGKELCIVYYWVPLSEAAFVLQDGFSAEYDALADYIEEQRGAYGVKY